MKEGPIYEQLLTFLSTFQPINGELVLLAKALAKSEFVHLCPRARTLFMAGNVPGLAGWVLHGILMEYEIDKLGNKKVKGFMESRELLLPDGLLGRLPSQRYVDTVDNCRLLLIPLGYCKKLLQQSPLAPLIFPSVLDFQAQKAKEREQLLCISPLIKRLAHFRDTKPGLFYHVPAQYLASYINTTPSSFSRARSRLSR